MRYFLGQSRDLAINHQILGNFEVRCRDYKEFLFLPIINYIFNHILSSTDSNLRS